MASFPLKKAFYQNVRVQCCASSSAIAVVVAFSNLFHSVIAFDFQKMSAMGITKSQKWRRP